MKKLLLFAMCLILTLTMFAGCGKKSSVDSTGGVVYRQLYAQEFTTFDYIATGSANELRVLANVIDGLVDYDEYGIVQPGLAESWEHNADKSVWTFKLRKGVKWVDQNGKAVADVTAHDWVVSAERASNAYIDSGTQYMLGDIIVGAQDYYDQTLEMLKAENAVLDGKAATVEDYYKENDIDPSAFMTFDEVGVKALDDYTLEYTTDGPCPFFLSVLSYSTYLPINGKFLEQQGESFGLSNENLLYNGAYIINEYEPQVKRTLTKNPLYWDKGNVTIDRLEYTYNADKTTIEPAMFQKGEIDKAEIGADILDEWMKNDATKDLVHPSPVLIAYSYFFGFNFEPRFDSQYEPENWMKAVNNENFRQALKAGLDRVKSLTLRDPYNPQSLLNNTVTPKTFAVGAGKDFTEYAPISQISSTDSFNETKAKEYKELAVKELTAGGATFPVKVLMPYNPSTLNWDKECQVVEQQMEALLGTDFIDIIVEAGPSTGFLSEVRRSGKHAFMKLNWGADYADPQTWTDPFSRTSTYTFMYTNPDKVVSDIPVTNKSPETQKLVEEYYSLVDAAKATTNDDAARYEAFAKAEAFLIGHAFIVPYSVDTDEYLADIRDPFSGQFAPYGLPPFKFKGVRLLEKSMNADEFNAAYAQWKENWKQAQMSAAQ